MQCFCNLSELNRLVSVVEIPCSHTCEYSRKYLRKISMCTQVSTTF